jgi:hypothetical protein
MGVPEEKWEIEANPDLASMTQVPSASNRAEVIGPHAAKKSL